MSQSCAVWTSSLRQPFRAHLFVSLTVSLFCTFFEAAAQPADARLLTPNEAIEREISGEQLHRYRVVVEASQFVSVAVTTKEIDLKMMLYGPDFPKEQSPLTEQDRKGEAGIERAIWIAKSAGTYWLEVLPVDKKTATAAYEIKIEDIRPAIETDEHRVAADWAFSLANKLAGEGTAEALQKALPQCEVALNSAQLAGARDLQADALGLSAFIHDRFGRRQLARDRYNQALTIYRELNDRLKALEVLNSLGLLHTSTGEQTKAIELFTEALDGYRELKMQGQEATQLNNIGLAHLRLEETQKSLDYYQQALALARAAKIRVTEATALTGIGLNYDALGQYQRAIEFYSEALPIARELGNLFGEGVVLNNLGMAWSRLAEFPRAIEYLEQSLALRRKTGDLTGEARTLNTLGLICHELGQDDKAQEHFSRALELFRKTGDKTHEGTVLLNIAYAQAHRQVYQEALKNLELAMALFQETGARQSFANALVGMASVHARLGEYERALTEIESCIYIIESVRMQLVSQDARVSFLAAKQNIYEIYTDILMQLHNRRPSEGLNAAALKISEQGRSRSLLDLLAEARVNLREGADLSLLARERQLRREFNTKAAEQLRLPKTENNKKQAEAIEKALSELGAQLKDLETKIRQSSPRYAGLTLPQPITVSEIQNQLLDENTILLEYALGTKRSWMWVVTPSEVASFELPPQKEIETAARKFYEVLTSRQPKTHESSIQYAARVAEADAKFRTEASALSRLLLGPIASRLGGEWKGKRLVIVAMGALDYLPFSSLPAPTTKSRTADGYRPLIIDHEVVNLPSASVLALIRRDSAGRPKAAKSLAILADPVFEANDPRVLAVRKREPDGKLVSIVRSGDASSSAPAIDPELMRSVRSFDRAGFPQLPFTRIEAEAISALIPQAGLLKATGFRANRTTATSETLSKYRFVHFATHGLLNSQHPELSGLVLSLVDENGKAQDGFLRLHEIYNLQLPADLVVLSACQTAIGKETKGEGLVGLTRGFMYAGAERVVASLWQVDDLATSELMKRFYRGMLLNKMRPAAALRAAQIEMMKQNRWASPYFWAGFTMQGEWR